MTSGPLADKQQKMGDHVENIKFSLDTQLNLMFFTFPSVFCCLSARGPDVSRFLYNFGNPGLLWAVVNRSHFEEKGLFFCDGWNMVEPCPSPVYAPAMDLHTLSKE